MDKSLDKIKGKVIDGIKEDNDGTHSYIILKFKDGSRANIISADPENKGVALITAELTKGGSKEEKPQANEIELHGLKGKKILDAQHEFNGQFDHAILYLQGDYMLDISPISNNGTTFPNLKMTFYPGSMDEKLNYPSILDDTNKDKQFVVESLSAWLNKSK